MGRRARGDRRTPIPPDQPNYTIRAAARRIDRSTRTIERWLRDPDDPLPHRKVYLPRKGVVVVVDHGPLMARYRATFKKTETPTETRT